MKLLISFSIFIFVSSVTAFSQDALTLYQDGVKLKEQKKVFEASQKFMQAIDSRPGYTEALYELGWCRNDLKDYTGALDVLRQTQPAWSTTPKAFFEMGYAHEKLAKYDSAIFYYNKCLALKSDYSGAFKQLGYIAYHKNENTSALEYFDKYENVVKNPINDYLYWYRKGFMQNALKDFAAAKISLTKSLEFKTDYQSTYLELGFACTRLKEDDQAIAYFNKSIEIDPKSHIGYNGIAEVYRDNKKDMPVAMTWYQKTLAINPSERKANFGMGYCLNSSSRFNEAIAYLKKAIEMENTYTAAYVEIGYSFYKTGKYSDALINLEKAISLNSKNENARYYKCLIYEVQKDKTNAQMMVDELRSLNSKHTTALQERVSKM